MPTQDSSQNQATGDEFDIALIEKVAASIIKLERDEINKKQPHGMHDKIIALVKEELR
jgi:hypothetical protein